MTFEEITEVIKHELAYQDLMSEMDSHVRENLTFGEYLLAINKLVDDANHRWYASKPPYDETRDIIRKIAALSVRMCMDEHGMPER